VHVGGKNYQRHSANTCFDGQIILQPNESVRKTLLLT
jgi:hypothetical protein